MEHTDNDERTRRKFGLEDDALIIEGGVLEFRIPNPRETRTGSQLVADDQPGAGAGSDVGGEVIDLIERLKEETDEEPETETDQVGDDDDADAGAGAEEKDPMWPWVVGGSIIFVGGSLAVIGTVGAVALMYGGKRR